MSVRKPLIVLFAAFMIFTAISHPAHSKQSSLNTARQLSYDKKYSESIVIYQKYLASHRRDNQARLELGDVYFWSGDKDSALTEYNAVMADPKFKTIASSKAGEMWMIKGDFKKAQELYLKSLELAPGDLKTRIKYAQVLSYDQKLDDAIAEYNKVLAANPGNLQAMREKADVVSWKGDFKDSVKIYDERLALQYDPEVARQKARVLGWAKKYSKAIATYSDAYNRSGEKAIELEEAGKQAFWNGWILTTIRKYRALLEIEPKNIEARFDLAQTEAYQHMWKASTADFQEILDQYKGHFRASDSLHKADIYWHDRALTPEIRYFRAKSGVRNTYVNRLTGELRFEQPLGEHLTARAGYEYDFYHFQAGADSIQRNMGKIGLDFFATPYLWGNAEYRPAIYSGIKRTSQLFSGYVSARPVDPVVITAFTQRADLDNNRTVFDKQIRTTDAGGRLQANIHRRWQFTGDYQYSWLNDGNRRNGFNIDNLVYLLYDPTRLTIDGRFEFYSYKNQVLADYWSPHNFWDAQMTVHWRHYLNKNGLYFGAKDTYYGVKYRFQVDRDKNVYNGGAFEFHHDFSHRIAVHAEGYGIYSGVYDDFGATAALTGRF